MLRHTKEHGDTIIEVMIAFTLFAMIAVGAIAIMNVGMNASQRALEITLIRQQIDTQAEALRYLQAQHLQASTSGGEDSRWQAIRGLTQNSIGSFEQLLSNSQCTAIPSNSFVVDVRRMQLKKQGETGGPESFSETSPAFAQVLYGSDGGYIGAYGIWIEAVKASNEEETIDFHIRACSPDTGNSTPLTLGTIVRLYDNV